MNSKAKQPEIRNGAFLKAREKLGLSLQDLAGQACLSARQIEQIENGEMSSFYGAKIKLTAAKKVAKLLGLSAEEAFNDDDGILMPKVEVTTAPEESSKLAKVATKPHQELAPEKDEEAIAVKLASVANGLGSVDSRQQPKKRVFIWLSIIAVAVFSAINLHPLFFTDKPEDSVIAKEGVTQQSAIEPSVSESSPSAAPALAQTPSALDAAAEVCPTADAVVSSYKPAFPKKSADLVYVQAKTKQVVCVVDASGKTQQKSIDPNAGASFYGAPPFKILSAGLAQVDVYFQGAKVRPANLDGKTILLEAGDISQPASSSDSQLR